MPKNYEADQSGVLGAVGSWWKKWTAGELHGAFEPSAGGDAIGDGKALAAKWPVSSNSIVLSIKQASKSKRDV